MTSLIYYVSHHASSRKSNVFSILSKILLVYNTMETIKRHDDKTFQKKRIITPPLSNLMSPPNSLKFIKCVFRIKNFRAWKNIQVLSYLTNILEKIINLLTKTHHPPTSKSTVSRRYYTPMSLNTSLRKIIYFKNIHTRFTPSISKQLIQTPFPHTEYHLIIFS